MIDYLEEQLRKGYEFYLNVDNLTRLQGILKKNNQMIPIHCELLRPLSEYENLYKSLLANSKYLKLYYRDDKYVLEKHAIINNGIYGALSKYGIELILDSNTLNNLLTEYGIEEKECEKVL